MKRYTFRNKWNNEIAREGEKIFSCKAENEIEAVEKLNDFFGTSKNSFPFRLVIDESEVCLFVNKMDK